MSTNQYARLLLSTVAIATLMAPLSFAQDPAGSEEVVVTAQKRAQKVQDIPIAMNVFGGKAIEERGIKGLSELAGSLPGVNFNQFSSAANVTIRGIGTTLTSGAGESSVAVHVDGVYLPQALALTMVQDDLERVEVLRGPQGTLYGRNSTGGVINFITVSPPSEFAAGARILVGNYDRERGEVYVGGPLSESVRARLSISADKRDGYITNHTTGRDVDDSRGIGGRLSIDADLNENWDAQIRSYIRKEDYSGPVYEPVDPNSPLAIGLGFLGLQFDVRPRDAYLSLTPDSSKKIWGLSLRNEWKFDDVTLVSLSGYTDFKLDSLLDPIGVKQTGAEFPGITTPNSLDRFYDTKTFSQEFNLTGGDRLKWLIGAYYLHQSTDAGSASFVFPPGDLTVFADKGKLTSLSAFFDATYSITDDFRIYGGLRILSEKVENELTSTVNAVPAPLCESALGTQDKKDTAVTGRIGAQFDAAKEVMLYAQYSRGYKGGGYSASSCGNEYDPETIDAWEIGVKSRFFEGALTFNASAFYYDYSNLQLELVSSTQVPVINAPSATVYGADFEVLARPFEGFTLDASLSLLHARYDKFETPDAGFTFFTTPTLDRHGVPLNNSPDWSANFGAEYEWVLGESGSLTARVEAKFTDKYYLREFNTPYTTVDGYTLTNAFLTYASPDEKYRVRGYVRNISDEEILAFVVGFGGALGAYQEPRTYGVELSVDF